MSLNNVKICCEISEDKIADCGKTAAGLRSGNFSVCQHGEFVGISDTDRMRTFYRT